MITKKDLKGLSKQELKEMQMHSEKISNLLRMKHFHSRLTHMRIATAIRVLVDLYAGERSFRGDSYE